jgi:hypothetical protein
MTKPLTYMTAEGILAPVTMPADGYLRVPPGWTTAGIVDARVFSVGEADTVHAVLRVWPNRVSAPCGAHGVTIDAPGNRVYWRDSVPTCPTCIARGWSLQ